MKVDTSTNTSNTFKPSASNTATKAAKALAHGPLPGKGPWVRVDGIWYTKGKADEWVKMPGQEDLKPKRIRKAKQA